MEFSENLSTTSSSELALNQPMVSDNGDMDREIHDENRADSDSDSDSDSMALDLALREEFESLVLKESEVSLKSDSEAKREDERDSVAVEEDHEVKNGSDESEGNREEGNEEAVKIEEGESSEDHEEAKNGGRESEKRVGERFAPKRYQYPVRPEAEDCAYYLRTWSCKFGLQCKFNHPRRKPGQQPLRERVRQKEKEDTSEKPFRLSEPLLQSEPSRQQECKYYLRSGGCKYGKSCKNLHDPRAKVAPAARPAFDYNFLGLPLRVGEKECMFYMRTGSCKFGVHCRFNHPDPTDEAGSENPARFNNAPVPLQSSSQSNAGPSWSSPRSMNETPPAQFVPLMPPPTQGPPLQNSDWNGYQAHIYLPPERNMPPLTAFTMNNHHSSQNKGEDYPERPGQPDCSFFLKTGDCKFRYNCKYNHPKNRASTFTSCTLSDKGLPLRPDQNICAHYSRYGICKYGPACKYDHSPNMIVSGGENQPMFGGLSGSMEGAGMARSGSRSEIAIQL